MNGDYNNGGNSCPQVNGTNIVQVEKQRYPRGERRRTQKEQNKVDNEKRREAMKALVASWMDRLQLISVITTFFASAEATLLAITTGNVKVQAGIEQTTNAAFLGALVLHASAATVSFLASFFLVNYKVHEAKAEAEGGMLVEMPGIPVNKAAIWSSNPHLVQVGPFHGQPPTNVLGRCHSLSVFLASVGFMLAMVGIGCFAWARHPTSASAFCTIWIGICVMLGVGIVVVPDTKLDGWFGQAVRVLRLK